MISILTAPQPTKISIETGPVLRTLAYFDIFDHPLTFEEVQQFSDTAANDRALLLAQLKELQAKGLAYEQNGYWALRHDPDHIGKRKKDEERARSRFPKALKVSHLIARFPFVRAVFISGSLSKGRMSEDGDIDFFIITAPGRLWFARTLLILYKKIFLLNSRRDFCVNYFVDTEHLTIDDKNRFTAMEIVTLLPMFGNGTVERFFAKNKWAFQHYPQTQPIKSYDIKIENTRFKHRLEQFFSGSIGNRLDSSAMNLTWRFWKWKFSDLDPKTFDLALRTRPYVSKHHPSNFQKRVLDGFNDRVALSEVKLKQTIDPVYREARGF